MQTHRLGVLLGERAQPATGTDDGDRLAGSGTGLLQSLVDGDAGAEDRGDAVEGDALGDVGDVSCRGDAVLLEGAVDGVAGELGGEAEGLVGLLAEGARQARVVEPLDADGLADLADVVGDELTPGHDDTGTLVAADERQLGRDGPVSVDGVEVSVAHAGVLDVDEDLLGAGFGDRDLLELNGTAGLFDDLGPLFRGDLGGRHDVFDVKGP